MALFKKKKKEESKWVQVGNFQLGTEKNASGTYVVARAIAGTWSLRWRDDTMMFGMMINLMNTQGAHEYLHTLLTLQYVATTYPHDMIALIEKSEYPVTKGFAKLIHEQNDFEASLKKKPTKKEHNDALKQVKDLYEIGEELKQAKKEDGIHGETTGGSEGVSSEKD